jgi:hypothetical protein
VWRSGSARALEEFFGAAVDRILYIGDNPAADSVPARTRGWRTALVVPELETNPLSSDATEGAPNGDADGWGSVLSENGRPTRFARVVRESADVYAARIERILSQGPDTVFRSL